MSEKQKATRIQDLLNRKRKGGNNADVICVEVPSTSSKQNNSSLSSETTAKKTGTVSEKNDNVVPIDKTAAELEAEARRKLIEKRAKDKILFEVKRAKERAEQQGPQGWVRPRSLNTNKQFLHRTIASAMFQPSKKPRINEDHRQDRDSKSPTR